MFVCVNIQKKMANVKTIFLGATGTSTEETQLECFCNVNEMITISLFDEKNSLYGYPTVIQLDKKTAIKFSKELRKEIALINEVEGGDYNG